MLASALLEEGRVRGVDVHMLGRSELDITDADAVRRTCERLRPAMVFHTAALTKVNLCEERPQEAWRVNASGTSNVAAAAKECEALLVYFSTDYVFNGSKLQPYLESDEQRPLNAYGNSKLRGERFAMQCPRHMVVRTSGIFGPRLGGFERNFFRSIYEQLTQSNGDVSVTGAQTTCVAYAPYLARMVMAVLEYEAPPPLVHLVCHGSANWSSWAVMLARMLNQDTRRIVSDAGGRASVKRPAYSVLASANPRVNHLMQEYTAFEGLKTYVGQLTGRGYQP
jgi:dTDP-4-dehydrorhamnose reductase